MRITGRLKDVIIRKGENVSAKEVEDLLYEHERVRDVAVIGVPERIAHVDELPRNATGKIVRNDLRDRYSD